MRTVLALTLAGCMAASAGCQHTDEASARDRGDAPTSQVPAPVDRSPARKPRPQVVLSPEGQPSVRVTVEVVSTPPRIRRGLMFRSHLGADHGMLFLMGRVADHSFWMKNTLIPLDMIFITQDMTVAGVVANAEPQTLKSRTVGKPSLYVLEVNGGWAARHGVTAGTRVAFENVAPEQ
jgi:uncharacterized protein